MTNIGLFPGWITPIIIVALLLVLGVIFLLAFFRWRKTILKGKAENLPKYRYEGDPTFWSSGYAAASAFFFAAVILVIGGFGVALIPFNAKYQSNYTITSTVTNVETVVDTGGKYVTETLVLTLDNFDEQVVSYDMRLLNSEDTSVDLICGVSWQNYGRSADLWVCELAS